VIFREIILATASNQVLCQYEMKYEITIWNKSWKFFCYPLDKSYYSYMLNCRSCHTRLVPSVINYTVSQTRAPSYRWQTRNRCTVHLTTPKGAPRNQSFDKCPITTQNPLNIESQNLTCWLTRARPSTRIVQTQPLPIFAHIISVFQLFSRLWIRYDTIAEFNVDSKAEYTA